MDASDDSAPDDGGVSDARTFLNSVSSHQSRPGDTSYLHPQFAVRLANAIQQARAAGIPVGLESGFRTNDTTGSAYDASGMSLHGNGVAGDVNGIGGPGSPQANQWAQIASQNGLFNPYTGGTGGGGSINNYRAQKEFNHWQLVPWTLESRPDVQAKLAAANGDPNKVWNAIAPTSAPGLSFAASASNGSSPAVAAISGKNAPPAAQSSVSDKVPDLLGSWGSPAPSTPAAGAPGATAKDSAGAPIVPGQDIVVQHHSSAVPDLLGSWAAPAEAPSSSPGAAPIPVGSQPSDISHPQLLAASTGVLNGVPIVGPYLQSGVEHASAAMHTLANGMPYADNLAAIQERTRISQQANPLTTTAGNVLGGVVGTVPAMAALPGAFGVGGGGLLTNALASGATGAAIGGADSAVRSGGDLNAMKQSAELGGVFGALAPVAGKAIGAGVNALSNVASRTTPAARNIFGVLQEAGLSPSDANNALARMGPHATLADINPALTTEAGGLASMGGAPTSILKTAMAARAGQADNRVAQAIDQTLGPKPDLTAVKQQIQDAASNSAAPYYNAARASGGSMDITPVLNDINSQLKNAVGGEAAVLNKAKAYLTDQKVGLPGPNGQPTTLIVPKDDPGALLKVRQALDGDIESLQRNGTIDGTSAGKSAYRAANDIRGQLDSVLKSDPNIAQGDANFAHHMGLKDAVDNGTELFTKGVRPEDFARSLATMSPEELAATRQGARVAIGDALENARRGTLSGAQSMFSRSSANRAKLDALFPNSGDVFDMLHGEASMRATEQRVAMNSATAERQAVHQKYAPSSEPGIGAAVPILGEAVGGGAGAAAAIGGRMLYTHARDALTRNALNRLTEGTARGLASTGPEQQEFMAQIARAGRSNAATNVLSGGSSALTNLLTRTIGQHLGQNALASP